MDKQKLIEQIIAKLEQELNAVTQAAKAAHEAATHEESKPEDQYDTRGLESSYLAGAQAHRAVELKQLITQFRNLPVREFKESDRVELGALVELQLNGKLYFYFLVAQGGGLSASFDGRIVQVITPHAPLGEELLDRKIGDTVEVEAQGVVREYEVKRIF